ncbi:MAG: hypothetical protein ABI654_15495 [Betaproteobacteria bacterium]
MQLRVGAPRLLPVSAIESVSAYLMAYGVLEALARRATEGGSWLVRVSLVRTGKWIADRGAIEDFALVPAEFPSAELEKLRGEMASPRSAIGHLNPVLVLSETPPAWARPPVPQETHPAAWPAR